MSYSFSQSGNKFSITTPEGETFTTPLPINSIRKKEDSVIINTVENQRFTITPENSAYSTVDEIYIALTSYTEPALTGGGGDSNTSTLVSFDRNTTRGGFGELATISMVPVFHCSPQYNKLHPQQYINYTSQGSVTAQNSVAILSTDAASVGAYSVLASKRRIHYFPGLGAGCRFAGYFATPIAGMQSYMGVGTAQDNYYIGYNGISFSIQRGYFGKPEVRELTLTNAASGDETVTVTLNGTAFNVNIKDASTAGVSKWFSAHQIAELGSYTGWYADHSDDRVIFTSAGVGARSGSYSFSSTGTAAGTFSTISEGQAKTDVYIYQNEFNYDTLDGTGDSGFTIDPTKGNVFEIRYQWLGYGAINFFVEDSSTGRFILFHQIKYTNSSQLTHVLCPSMPFQGVLYNTGTASALSMGIGSICGYTDGEPTLSDPIYGYNRSVDMTATTRNVLSLRTSRTFNGIYNNSEVFLKVLFISTGSFTKTVSLKAVLNPDTVGTTNTVTNYTNDNYLDEGYSVVLYDETSTTYTGGTIIESFSLPKDGVVSINLEPLKIFLQPNDIFLLSCTAASSGDITVSINWVENH